MRVWFRVVGQFAQDRFFFFSAAVAVAYAGVRQRKRGVRLWSLRWRKEA